MFIIAENLIWFCWRVILLRHQNKFWNPLSYNNLKLSDFFSNMRSIPPSICSLYLELMHSNVGRRICNRSRKDHSLTEHIHTLLVYLCCKNKLGFVYRRAVIGKMQLMRGKEVQVIHRWLRVERDWRRIRKYYLLIMRCEENLVCMRTGLE